MELLIAALVGAGAVWAGRRVLTHRDDRRHDTEELAGVRRLADEDVTLLGEQLRRLDDRVGDAHLDEDGRADYQRALDAYESAQRTVQHLRRADEVSTVTDTLSTGRYALACVEARVAGRPLPERRVPCFFNPQHGPSVTDVRYTAPGRGTRTVPACAQDSARLAEGEAPEVRMVRIGSRNVPYWQAGSTYLPYGRGYFVTAGTAVTGAYLGWAFAGEVPSAGGTFSSEYGGAMDAGLFNDSGGSWDGGGGDGGGLP